MSHWNYRLVNVDEEIGLYEVYYDDNGKPNGRGEEPAVFIGESKAELWLAMVKCGEAFAHPIMTDSDLGG